MMHAWSHCQRPLAQHVFPKDNTAFSLIGLAAGGKNSPVFLGGMYHSAVKTAGGAFKTFQTIFALNDPRLHPKALINGGLPLVILGFSGQHSSAPIQWVDF
jgi:hypothetical protein